ncbi:four helix bundle protein [Haloferula sp.]|uniref:four helix bundle protein n=1 Tax=Haloferula sp. TaxID=2497595 RepID=UPI003C740DAD
MSVRFRFENLEIWQRAAAASDPLFDIADRMEEMKRFRWAEQLRAAVMSITNNIAEGSGSVSNAEFAQFLNFARRSVFETANILILLNQRGVLIERPVKLLDELEEISRMIIGFRRTLR